eukprot:TRINITY_DN16018_c0_g1_i1.p1 TRINITY_DN16018_c0_g1~~TRINITY_DN16018_c0_g1_i1.p1  ORF type:complete len:413 (+),score=88.30 TRINITY_DN16018_c0_g1_i1:81-1319(+)
MATALDLPEEMFLHLCSYAHPRSLGMLAKTCKQFHHYLKGTDEQLWEALYRRKWPDAWCYPLPASATWRQQYTEKFQIERSWQSSSFRTVALPPTQNSCECVALTDKYVASGAHDGQIQIADANTGKVIHTPSIGKKWILEMQALGPLLAVSTASPDSCAYVFDFASGALLFKQETHTGGIWTMQMTNAHQLVTGSADGSILVSDIDLPSHQAVSLKGHTDAIYDLALSPDETLLVSGSKDKTVRLWDMRTHEQLHCADEFGHHILAVAFDPVTRLQWGGCSRDNSVRLFDVMSGQRVFEGVGHANHVLSMRVRDTMVLSGGRDKTARLWDTRTGGCVQTFEMASDVFHVQVMDDAHKALFCTDGEFIIWDYVAGRSMSSYKTAPGKVHIASNRSRSVAYACEHQAFVMHIV